MNVAGEFLEGDLVHYFRVSLYDVLAGKVAPRHVLALLRALPPDSRSFAVIRAYVESIPDSRKPPRDPLHRYLGWDPVNQWLALIAEQLVFYRYEHARANGDKGMRRPDPLDMPGRSIKPHGKTSNLYSLARAAAGLGT